MKNYELIIFDLDGTLADTSKDITESVNYVLKTFDLNPLTVEEVKFSVGGGIEDLLLSVVPKKHYKKINKSVKFFRKHYYKHLLDNTPLYPGVKLTLQALHNFKKVVLSNKPEKHCLKLLEGMGIDFHFNKIAGGDTYKERKPKEFPFKMICKGESVPYDKTLMIGDGISDIVGANNCGMHSVAVTYGFAKKEELCECKPNFYIDKFEPSGN